jgi:hypothetical protein
MRPRRTVKSASDSRGKNGKGRRSLGFAYVRSLRPKPLLTAGLSERARTVARIAMRKVEGSSPFIRFKNPRKSGVFV